MEMDACAAYGHVTTTQMPQTSEKYTIVFEKELYTFCACFTYCI